MDGVAIPGATARPFDVGGQLHPQMRGAFEARLGFDFSHVRVHADGESASAARQLDARAFTVGHRIFFGAQQFAPDRSEGRYLLAHELVHTVQQRTGTPMVQRRSAGGCSATADVDEARDDAKAAGRAAHQQIQTAFAAVLTGEAEIPRASKEGNRVGTLCPKEGTPNGFADLFGYFGGNVEIGEIKSVEGAAYVRPQVVHYLRRVGEATDRLLGKKNPMCAGAADRHDRAFDNRYFNGAIQAGADPGLMPLTTVMPKGPIWLGPFSLDPRKQLYCEGNPDGGVLYWCTKKRRKEDERKQPFKFVVTQPARTKKRVRFVDYDRQFSDMLQVLPSAVAAEGSRIVFGIPQALYEAVRGAEQTARSLRLMRVELRDRPIFAFRAVTWGTLAALAGAAEVGALVALVAAAVPLVAGVAAEATVATGLEAGAAVETAAVATEVTETAAAAIEVIDATAAGAEATGLATSAAEAIPLWMAPAAQEFAKRATLSILAVLVGAGMSKSAAAATVKAGLKNPHVLTAVDVTGKKLQPEIGDPIAVDGEAFRVIGILRT